MRLDPSDELFIDEQIERIRLAIEDRAGQNIDHAWSLGRRVSEILVANAHARIADLLCLAQAENYDTQIEVWVNGAPGARYEAGPLRSEVWVGLVGSAHGAIDDRASRAEIMVSELVGDDSLAWSDGNRGQHDDAS